MTSNKRFFLNTPPLFENSRFNIRKVVFRIFLQSINHELWETIVNGLFIPAYQVNYEILDRLDRRGKEKI